MAMLFEKREKSFPYFCERERFFGEGIADETEFHTRLVPTVLRVGIERPKVITTCFAFLSDIPVGMKILQVIFSLH